MKRFVAGLSSWWIRLFVVSVVAVPLLGVPQPYGFAVVVGSIGLAMVRPPWNRDRQPVEVAPPVEGRWVALNSPGSKIPSHGIRAYGQTYAIDILHPRPDGSPTTIGWGLGMIPAERFSSFGEPIRAVADGTVVSVSDAQRDHRSRTTWPSLIFMFTVEAFAREIGGARFVLGNHVVVDHGGGVYAAYAHLRRGSVGVRPGDRVEVGEQIGELGNSGNSSEPHLHVQLMDDPSPTRAAGIPFRWHPIDLTDEVDPTLSSEPVSGGEPGLPANGQIFTAAPR